MDRLIQHLMNVFGLSQDAALTLAARMMNPPPDYASYPPSSMAHTVPNPQPFAGPGIAMGGHMGGRADEDRRAYDEYMRQQYLEARTINGANRRERDRAATDAKAAKTK
jgi:hypothetical protein